VSAAHRQGFLPAHGLSGKVAEGELDGTPGIGRPALRADVPGKPPSAPEM
jgi:hypothetical protein